MKTKRAYKRAYVEKAEDGVITAAVATEESEDRDGDTLKIADWDIKNFEKNPVLLWAHDYRQLPIGRVEKIWFDGKKMMFRPKLAIAENPMAKTIYDLFQGGFLNAFSVGFRYFEGEAKKLKHELLEISVVPVPAHQSALVAIKSAGVEPTDWEGQPLKKYVEVEHLTTKCLHDNLKRKKKILSALTH